MTDDTVYIADNHATRTVYHVDPECKYLRSVREIPKDKADRMPLRECSWCCGERRIDKSTDKSIYTAAKNAEL